MFMMDWLFIALLIFFVVVLTPPLGTFMAKLYQGEPTFLHPLLGRLESFSYRLCGISPYEEMYWTTYLKSLALFNLTGLVFLFLLQLIQSVLPFNPQHFAGVEWPLALNTAVSFVTNTNWQSYAGEVTLSYLTQMLGLTVQNFLSAATGMGVLMALIRGLSRKSSSTIGNFWTDLSRTVIYLLLPLSFILAIVLVSQGVVQTLHPYQQVQTLENATQTIPLGPVASQIAIKQLGTNGGGFFNANSAHPFENPTPISNFIETLAILLIPAALTYTYGLMIGSKRHGWLIFRVMLLLWVIGLSVSIYSESIPNPIINGFPSLEGKETRIGNVPSLIWSVTTTATANGSVNAMISSLSPLAGGVAMINMMMGEIIFGGVGVGLCGMIMFILLTVFISGLMVGRTPEYLGKKIEKVEMQWVMAAILIPSALILIGSGLASIYPEALSSLDTKGPHGLSELLYTFASTSGNNGSAFAGLNANTTFFNLTLAAVMLLCRAAIIIPSLAIAGSLVEKKTSPHTVGTFSTNSGLFISLLIGIILIVNALTFFPALSLGPIVEHLLMLEGHSF